MNHQKIVRVAITLLTGIICTSGIANAQGIVFGHNLDDALAKAKVENKLVFIDFYTSWCAPCKVMSNDVFPIANVGTFFNTNFINCKIQCDDKGEGVELGKKYQVGAYPTLMFLNKDGEIVHSTAGSLSANELIELGKDALNPDKNLWALMNNWKTGKKDAESAKIYLKTLKAAYRSEKASNDFIAYFNNLTPADKVSKSTFELINIVIPVPTTPVFNYLEDHLIDFFAVNDSVIVKRFLINRYTQYLYSFINPNTKEEYQVALEKFKIKKFSFEDEVVMYMNVFETLLYNPFDTKEYQKRGTAFLDKYGKNYDGYTTYLASLLGNCTGKYNEGAAGIKWMEDLLKRNPNTHYLSTYFYILWRNHRWDEAIKVGKKIRANNTKNNIENTTIDKQIADCITNKEKYAQKDADAKAQQKRHLK